jgi:PadR family transcriptional regulator, regulatory protein PadR
MGKSEYLGAFEQFVLFALLRLGENAYGVTIRREIESGIGKNTALGAVYTTLDRLEKKGFVSSREGDPTPERGGRAKRYFRIEAPGQAALARSEKALSAMSRGLEVALES